MDIWYVAMDFGHYGIGKTIAEAEKNLKAAGGKFRTYFVKEVTQNPGQPKPKVTRYGELEYSWCDIDPVVVKAVKNGKPVADLAGV